MGWEARSIGPVRWFSSVVLYVVLIAFSMHVMLPTSPYAQEPSTNGMAENSSGTLPPIQTVESVASPPFYKTWWFWTLVAVAVAGGVAAAAGGGGGSSGGAAGPTGTVTVSGPPP